MGGENRLFHMCSAASRAGGTPAVARTHYNALHCQIAGLPGDAVGMMVGDADGAVGTAVGDADGAVGTAVGDADGAVGEPVGTAVGIAGTHTPQVSRHADRTAAVPAHRCPRLAQCGELSAQGAVWAELRAHSTMMITSCSP